jgi:hypothetical protein
MTTASKIALRGFILVVLYSLALGQGLQWLVILLERMKAVHDPQAWTLILLWLAWLPVTAFILFRAAHQAYRAGAGSVMPVKRGEQPECKDVQAEPGPTADQQRDERFSER